MKGFRNTTKMQSGHSFKHPSQWFPQGFATGGTVNRFARGGEAKGRARDKVPRGIEGVDEHADSPHDDGNALQHREVPTTEELSAAGGHSPLKPGFSHGGKAEKHFHVHHHYHGGKVGNGKGLKKMEMQAESDTPDETKNYRSGGKSKIHIKAKNKGALHRDMGIPEGQKIPKSKIRSKLARDKAHHNTKGVKRDVFALNFGHAEGGHIHDETSIPSGYPDYATGGTINRLNAGGALYARGGHGRHHPAPRRSGPPPGALQALAALGNAAAGPRGPMPGAGGPPMPPGAAPVGPPPGLAARGGRMRSR